MSAIPRSGSASGRAGGRAVLTVGKKVFELGKWTREEFQERLDYQLRRPLNITTIGGRRYWLFENNLEARLPGEGTELAREFTKDPLVFDFLGLTEEAETSPWRRP